MTAFLDLCCSKKELPLWGLDLTYNDMSVSRPIMKTVSCFLRAGNLESGNQLDLLVFDFGFGATCLAHLVQSRPFY